MSLSMIDRLSPREKLSVPLVPLVDDSEHVFKLAARLYCGIILSGMSTLFIG